MGFCCLLDRTLVGEKLYPGISPFLARTENNTHSLEIYRNIVT